MDSVHTTTSFTAFLKLACDHPEEGMLLQEFAGYCLWPDNRRGRWLALSGRIRASAFYLRIIKALVGGDNVAELKAGALDNPFYRGFLQHMAVVYAVDHIEEHLNAAHFTALVDGRPVPATRENGEAFTFVPTCKLILISEKPDVFHRPMPKEIRTRMLHVGMDGLSGGPALKTAGKAQREGDSLRRRAEEGYTRLNYQNRFSSHSSRIFLCPSKINKIGRKEIL